MEHNQFNEVMRKHTTDELLEILNVKRYSYTSDAIAAVENVLNERNVIYEKRSDEEFAIEEMEKVSFIEKIYASNCWVRFFEFLIDYIMVFGIFFIITFSLGMIFEKLWVIIYFMYYFILESTIGKTIGKSIFGLIVVDKNGEKASAPKILVRTCCRFIPLDAISFIDGGFLNHELKSNWHDRFSETFVVRECELEE